MADSTRNESLLIQKIKRGNEYAFEITFLKYYEPMCKSVWTYVRSKELSKEIVQDVFTDLWDNREDLDSDGHLRGLLFVAARNKALDNLKHNKVVRNYQENAKKIKQEKLYAKIHPEKPTAPSLINDIDKAIDELPPKAREVFYLIVKKGLPIKK